MPTPSQLVGDWARRPRRRRQSRAPQEGLRSKFKSVPPFPPCYGGVVPPFPCFIALFPTRLHPPPTAATPSSTQNAPGFALLGLFRVCFAVFRAPISGPKFVLFAVCGRRPAYAMIVPTPPRKGNETMKIEIGENLPAYFKPAYPEEFELFSHFEVTAGIPTRPVRHYHLEGKRPAQRVLPRLERLSRGQDRLFRRDGKPVPAHPHLPKHLAGAVLLRQLFCPLAATTTWWPPSITTSRTRMNSPWATLPYPRGKPCAPR